MPPYLRHGPDKALAARLLDHYAADNLITAIKDNQPTMLDDLREMDFSTCLRYETLVDRIKDLSEPERDGSSGLNGRQQTLRIEHQGHLLNSGHTSTELIYTLTSLARELATPQQLAALTRLHRHIENRLHYGRGFSYNEDRFRVFARNLPRHLACLTNPAISIICCQPQFRYVPETNRHFVNRAQEALD